MSSIEGWTDCSEFRPDPGFGSNSEWFTTWDERRKTRPEGRDLGHFNLAKRTPKLLR
jgi:hypothetical protein